MQIQLKQSEIEEALKDYIVKQGLSLKGRTVAIDFTSGRKDNGITADIDISGDELIPGFETDEPEIPHASINTPHLKTVSASSGAATDEPVSAKEVTAEVIQADEADAAPSKPSSLFGS